MGFIFMAFAFFILSSNLLTLAWGFNLTIHHFLNKP